MDKEGKARIKAAKKAAKANKTPWYRNFIDAYKLVTSSFAWTKWAIWLIAGVLLLACIVLAAVTGHWVRWIITGIALFILVPLIFLSALVSKAAYRRIDGVPGAAGSALSQLGRGWVTREEPVQFTNDMKNFVFRAVGRPGVVLVAEGPGDLSSLVRAAAKQVNRTVASAPVVTVYIGHGERQVKLENLTRTLAKMPKKMTAQEVADTAERLDAVASNALPIPKGIDPMKMRTSARARIR